MSRTGFIAALLGEAQCLCATLQEAPARVPIDERRVLQICGVGQERAAAAAEALVAEGCTALVSWGTAGALGTQLQAGTLLLTERIIREGVDTWELDEDWLSRLAVATDGDLPLARGALLSGPTALMTPADKARARADTGAVAVDMESAAIAAVAARHGLPMLAVRVIADTAGDRLPKSALHGVDVYGQPQLRALAGSLVRHPADVASLVRLGRCFTAAKRTLCSVAALGPEVLAH